MTSKKRKVSELERYYSQFPEWYWVYGLHDAKILVFFEEKLPTDWKKNKPRYNSLEIDLDPSGARTNLRKITFFNYSLKMDFDFHTLKEPWWMGDTLTVLPDGRFALDVEIEDAGGTRYVFSVNFEDVVVE